MLQLHFSNLAYLAASIAAHLIFGYLHTCITVTSTFACLLLRQRLSAVSLMPSSFVAHRSAQVPR